MNILFIGHYIKWGLYYGMTIYGGSKIQDFSDSYCFKSAYFSLNLSKLRGIESRDLFLTRY